MTGADKDVLPAGLCVCGNTLPDGCPSDWACSEVCQAAWMQHQANPEYPHPRDIRASMAEALQRAAARGAERRRTRVNVDGPTVAPSAVAEGTEINVDGQDFVRVGQYWQPAGMWTPVEAQLGELRYERWCPQCRRRVPSLLHPASDVQECAECQRRWEGRPLLGWVESRGDPWPGVRLRLSDGHRSIVTELREAMLAADQAPVYARRVWLRMERTLCGGYADSDQPDERQRRRRERNLNATWHLHEDHLHIDMRTS